MECVIFYLSTEESLDKPELSYRSSTVPSQHRPSSSKVASPALPGWLTRVWQPSATAQLAILPEARIASFTGQQGEEAKKEGFLAFFSGFTGAHTVIDDVNTENDEVNTVSDNKNTVNDDVNTVNDEVHTGNVDVNTANRNAVKTVNNDVNTVQS
jgi:hypothetical protein